MKIAKIIIGFAVLIGATTACADGFVITRSISNGRELRLIEHASECDGGPGALIYRRQKLLAKTCDVRVTPAGATVTMPAFEPRLFFPRDTLR